MNFCKRCGSITLDGICYNCSGSNFISNLPFEIPTRLENSFFSPTVELERRMNWKIQLEDRKDLITGVQMTPMNKKEVTQNIGNIAPIKMEDRYELQNLGKEHKKNMEEDLKENLDPIENLISGYPHIKKRMDWRKQIERNTSVITEIKKYNLPTNTELKQKTGKKIQKKNRDTEINRVE